MDGYLVLCMDCNHKCIFCSVKKQELYLTREDFENNVDALIKTGTVRFVFTGGEPTMHPDIVLFAKIVKEKLPSAEIRIITNGTKLNEKLLTELSPYVKKFVFSIHHIDPKMQMEINKSDEIELPKVFENIKIATRLGFEISINTTIIEQNYRILPQIVETLSALSKNITTCTMNFVDAHSDDEEIFDALSKGIVPRYYKVEPYLKKAIEFCRSKFITLRIERVPLCYMRGNEDFSSEALRACGVEYYETFFLDSVASYFDMAYVKDEKSCKKCYLNSICPGVKKNYYRIHGSKETYPVLDDTTKVVFNIKQRNRYKDTVFAVRTEEKNIENNIYKMIDFLGGAKRFFQNINANNVLVYKDNLIHTNRMYKSLKEHFRGLSYISNMTKEKVYRPFNRVIKAFEIDGFISKCSFSIVLSTMKKDVNFFYTLDHLIANPMLIDFKKKLEQSPIEVKNDIFLDMLSFIKPKIRLSITYDNVHKILYAATDPLSIELALSSKYGKTTYNTIDFATKRKVTNSLIEIKEI